ncbi:hypothetical protein D3C81_1846780 [compost metagenome]
MLIEYNGEQHYEPKSFGMKDEYEIINKFNQQQINDEIKHNYCEKNKLKFIVIPYWDKDNIKSILDNAYKE